MLSDGSLTWKLNLHLRVNFQERKLGVTDSSVCRRSRIRPEFCFLIFFSGYSLKCNYCVSFKSWDDCKNSTKQITCSNSQDRCFKANLKAVETGSGVTGESFGKGCDTSAACRGRSICSSSSSVKITKCEIDCCKVFLLLYFCCTRGHVTSRCQGLFPPHPFFKGKALGTMLENYREFSGSRRKPFYSQEFPRSFSLFLFEYSPENECWCKLAQKNFQEFLGMILGKSQEIPGFSLRNFARETGEYRSYFDAFGRKKITS